MTRRRGPSTAWRGPPSQSATDRQSRPLREPGGRVAMMKSLTRAQLLITAILLPWARSAHGQQCGVLTGLETRGLPRPKTHVNRYYLAAQGTTILSEDPVPVKD